MPFLDVDRGSIFYESVGDGPPIVWVHGLPLSSEAWGPQLETFRDRHRNLLYDLRGYGRSTKLPADEEAIVDLHVDDLQRVMGAAGIPRATIVGHASGGHVAMTFAARHPDRIDRLVLVNASPFFGQTDDWPHGFSTQAIAAMHAVADESVEALIARLLDPQVVFQDLSPAASAPLCDAYARLARQAGKATLLAFFDKISRHDARPLLRDIVCPTLILCGPRGHEVTSAVALYLRHTIAQSVLAEVPGGDHFLCATRPALVNALIAAFIGEPT